MQVSLIVLAAGMGTRMNSDTPKVLHRLGGVPMLHHALAAGASLEPDRVVVVTGHGAEAGRDAAHDFRRSDHLRPAGAPARHRPCRGPGRAPSRRGPGEAIVLFGDTPFIRPETFEAMLAARARHDLVVLGFEPADPARYGRLVTHGDDAGEDRRIQGCHRPKNAPSACATRASSAPRRRPCSASSPGSSPTTPAGEYYLTDIVETRPRRGPLGRLRHLRRGRDAGHQQPRRACRCRGAFPGPRCAPRRWKTASP